MALETDPCGSGEFRVVPPEDLRAEWAAAFALPDAELSQGWLERVMTHYAEPQRHYHTRRHIGEMFGFLQGRLRGLVEDELAFKAAVFFHDVIYDPRSGTNEEDSAVLWLQFASEAQLPAELAEKVNAWILATKKHALPEGASHDLALFLDVDMAVLGRPQAGYDVYGAQIRQEFIHVPEADYCRRRAEVLRSFLAEGTVYGSPEMRELLEANAAANVAREAEVLEGGSLLA